MQNVFHYLGIGFAALFTAKMAWLGYLAWKNRLPDRGKGDVSGWGTPD